MSYGKNTVLFVLYGILYMTVGIISSLCGLFDGPDSKVKNIWLLVMFVYISFTLANKITNYFYKQLTKEADSRSTESKQL